MNSHPSAPHGPRFRSPGLFCVLIVLTLGLAALTGRAANTAANTAISLQSQINQLEAQIEASGTITQAQQDLLDSLLAGLEAARKQSNDALKELDRLIDDANNVAGGTIIADPNLDPDRDRTSPSDALGMLMAAIGRGNASEVEQVRNERGGLLATALANPANAQMLAGALTALKTGTTGDAAAAANISNSLAALAGAVADGSPKSASVLVSAVSAVISKADVISAAPGVVATAATRASSVAGKPAVANANPGAAAQVAKESAAIAKNPVVIAAAPQQVATINTNVGLINNTTSVSTLLGQTTNQQPLDVTTVSTSS